MAAAPGFLSVEQFEALYTDERKPYFEYWFGEAVQKSVPNSKHGVVQMLLGMLLMRQGWRVGSEIRLKLSKMAYPVPDVIASASPIQTPYPTHAFDLCIEILSPGDRLNSVFAKAAHYLDWGIGWVWIIDPEKRIAYSMSSETPEPRPIDIAASLSAGLEGSSVNIPMHELFTEMEKQLS